LASDLTHRALPVVEAVRGERVVAFAPEILRCEFLKIADEKRRPRTGERPIDGEVVERHVRDFLKLRITYVRGESLVQDAWELLKDQRLSATDCWYVACARRFDAELWISHEHADRLVDKARRAHDKVFLLTQRRF
jgi:predicted nucleic acid-binding protein